MSSTTHQFEIDFPPLQSSNAKPSSGHTTKRNNTKPSSGHTTKRNTTKPSSDHTTNTTQNSTMNRSRRREPVHETIPVYRRREPVHETIPAYTKCIVCSRANNVSLDFLSKDYVSHHDVTIPAGVTHVWCCWSCAH